MQNWGKVRETSSFMSSTLASLLDGGSTESEDKMQTKSFKFSAQSITALKLFLNY